MTHWPPVLMYHSIAHASYDPNNICVPPEQFEDQMRHLQRNDMRAVSMDELLRAVRRGNVKGLVGLTFDDGYENFLHAALPVLESCGFGATVFVVAGMIGKVNSWDEEGPKLRLLDANGVREAAARGAEIGTHGLRHVRLSSISGTSLLEEVEGSRRIISEVLGGPVEGFCYPYGDLNRQAVQAVREAGYVYSCAYKTETRHGNYAIPRIYVGKQDKGFRLSVKLRWMSTIRQTSRHLGMGWP